MVRLKAAAEVARPVEVWDLKTPFSAWVASHGSSASTVPTNVVEARERISSASAALVGRLVASESAPLILGRSAARQQAQLDARYAVQRSLLCDWLQEGEYVPPPPEPEMQEAPPPRPERRLTPLRLAEASPLRPHARSRDEASAAERFDRMHDGGRTRAKLLYVSEGSGRL